MFKKYGIFRLGEDGNTENHVESTGGEGRTSSEEEVSCLVRGLILVFKVLYNEAKVFIRGREEVNSVHLGERKSLRSDKRDI